MSFFSSLINSCFGFRSYHGFLDVPYWRTLLYLAQLMALLAAILVFGSVSRILSNVESISQFVARDFPLFEIRNGIAVATSEQTVVSGSRVVLDLDGTRLEQIKPTSAATAIPDVLIQRQQFLVRKESMESFLQWLILGQQFEWPKRETTASAVEWISIPFVQFSLQDGVFNASYCRQLLRDYVWLMAPTMFVVLTVLGFLFCLAQAHLFAAIGSLIEQHLPERFTFAQVRNLATYSITPAAIIVTVYQTFNLHGLNLPLIYLVAYGIFFIGSANGCRPRREEAPVDDSGF